MSVDIGRAVEEGARRTIAKNGLYLVVITWVLGVINGLLGNTVAQGMLQRFQSQFGGMPMPATPVGPTLGLSPGMAWLLSIVVTLVWLVVAAAGVRTFVTEDTESLPAERFTRNLGWMLVNLVVGGIVFGIVVTIGFILLIIPGLFLLVSLFFWQVYVVEEDANFIEGFQDSWALTRGNRLMLFVLGVIVVIVAGIVSWIFGIPQAAGMTGSIGLIVAQVGSAFAGVFVLATAARTWIQLTEDGEAVAEGEAAAE